MSVIQSFNKGECASTFMKNLVNGLTDIVPKVNIMNYGADSYKVGHILFETEGVKGIYSNFTPRFDHYMKKMVGDSWDGLYVVFGFQYLWLRIHTFMKNGFFAVPKDEAITKMIEMQTPYIGTEDYSHFEALHDLGYLPVVVKTLDEGELVPVGVPCMTITNTLPEFRWLPNFLETMISTDFWKQMTVATMARQFRKISNEYAILTTGGTDGVEFQNHDFHVRGASGWESAGINGVAFLTASHGTDNMPSILMAEKYYGSINTPESVLGMSIKAGEHSVTTLGITLEQLKAKLKGVEITRQQAETLYLEYLLDKLTGYFSYVADSYDYFGFLRESLVAMKDKIMNRDGKLVVRGDSGDPIHIICGYFYADCSDALNVADVDAYIAARYDSMGYEAIKCADGNVVFKFNDDEQHWEFREVCDIELVGTIEYLYELFGGTINSQGFKELDPHIGMIYGDGITLNRQEEILSRLAGKGFSSLSVVHGVGSYSLNLLGRDHLGSAIKATHAIVEIDGVDYNLPICKDPATDTSKKSALGYIKVDRDEDGNIFYKDQVTKEEEETGLLTVLYEDGVFHKATTIEEIREKLGH